MSKLRRFFKVSTIATLVLTLFAGVGFGGYNFISNQTHITYLDSDTIDIGEVTPESVENALRKLSRFKKSEKVVFFISSPGGVVVAGQMLIKEMQKYENTVCVVNIAASMAFSILQQGCKTRLVTENAVLMQHRVRLGVGGPTWNDLQDMLDRKDPATLGRESEFKRLIEEMKKLEEENNIPDARRLGMSLEEFVKLISFSWWLKGSKEILEANAADGKTIVIRNVNNSKEFLDRLPNTGSERVISLPDEILFYLKALFK